MNYMLYNSRPLSLKKPMKLSVTFNVPRFVTFEQNHEVTIRNDQFDFTETYFYLKGSWSLVLKPHGEGVYLSKRKLG